MKDESDWQPSSKQKLEAMRDRQRAEARAAWMRNAIAAVLILIVTAGAWSLLKR